MCFLATKTHGFVKPTRQLPARNTTARPGKVSRFQGFQFRVSVVVTAVVGLLGVLLQSLGGGFAAGFLLFEVLFL